MAVSDRNNACLSALECRKLRSLPAGMRNASDDPQTPLEPASDIAWLQPIPDALFDEVDWEDPAKIVATRSSVRPAFVAVLQHLPARQRAVLILRDVMALRAAEVATALGISTAAVTRDRMHSLRPTGHLKERIRNGVSERCRPGVGQAG
jgi:RNA polymerase sigma-70 factor (ECF subfamily)